MSRTSAVIKRHGDLLCTQVRETLSGHEALVVLPSEGFPISAEADRLAAEQGVEACRTAHLTYDPDTAARTIDVDLIVVDTRIGSVTAYEIKRGFGPVDAGKRRQTLRDGFAVAAHLSDYAQRRGHPVLRSDFKVLSIYGRTGLPSEVTINGAQLDEHFAHGVSAPMWQSERYLRNCLRAMLDGRPLPRA
jgi:hypothetical protein